MAQNVPQKTAGALISIPQVTAETAVAEVENALDGVSDLLKGVIGTGDETIDKTLNAALKRLEGATTPIKTALHITPKTT